MMAVDFPEANATFGKPPSMTDEQCGSLRVWRSMDPFDPHPLIISCWKFSYEDLQEIQKTGVVWLSVVGFGTPPVSVFTENPFTP